MPKATWNNMVIAESDNCIVVEGNQYFPPEDVKKEYLVESDYRTACPGRGLASYYHIEVEGERNQNAAWYYPSPKEAANHIKDYVAFWHGVTVED
jgi:uncharacterized protein (DUF427 family)